MFHHNPADSRLIRPQWLVKTPLIQFNKPVGRGTFRGVVKGFNGTFSKQNEL